MRRNGWHDRDGTTYVRWRQDADRLSRVMPPMSQDHPCATYPCLVCAWPLANGDPIQLIALGPELGYRERFSRGEWINAVAVALHAACLGSDPVVTRRRGRSDSSQTDG